jgi:acetyl esterase
MKKMYVKENHMGAWAQSIKTSLEKSQGSAARALDRLPTVVQKQLVKRLKYPYQFSQLDPFIQCLMALQLKQGKVGFIGQDYHQSRELFEKNIKSLAGKSTPIEQVEDLRLPLISGTVFARHYHPAPQKKLPCVVFYHGGGFVVGSLDSHDEVCRLIAKHAGVQVISIDYPLAPEVSPHQLIKICEDALAWVYQNRRQLKILKNRIAVAGDSAGGNIATVVAQRAQDKAYAAHAQLLLYPVVDFKSRHPSFFAYKDGLVLTGQDVDVVEELYAKQHNISLDDPIISPTYGKLDHLAPAFIITAGHDVLHDEASIYSHKLIQRGVSVHYQEYKDQTHGFVNLTPISKRAKKYVIEISKNFRKFWDKQH